MTVEVRPRVALPPTIIKLKLNKMKQLNTFKKLFIGVSALFLSFGLSAQEVRETRETVDNVSHPAFSVDVKYPQKVAETAIGNYFKSTNMKSSSSKDFKKYAQVNFPTISDKQIDMYTKVSGNKSLSTVTILVSKGYEHFVSSSDDLATANNIKAFMATIPDIVKNHNLTNEIIEQEKVITKTQKSHEQLLKDQQKLAKQIEMSEKELAAQKTKLDNLNSLR